MEDTLIWLVTKSGEFTVKSFYNVLELNLDGSFAMSNIWISWVQLKVGFFFFLCGRQCEVKFETLNQIQRQGWSLENWRFLCLRHEKSIDHLLLHCETTRVF